MNIAGHELDGTAAPAYVDLEIDGEQLVVMLRNHNRELVGVGQVPGELLAPLFLHSDGQVTVALFPRADRAVSR